MSFDQCADAYIAAHRAGWRNARHASSGKDDRDLRQPDDRRPAGAGIDTALVMKVLEPIWTAKPETAARLRGRIEAVLDWAKARGYRTGENPARWKGHLDHLLPEKAKVAKVAHHAAMPHAEVAAFMAELRRQEGIAARALEFAILTACRTGEVVGAQVGRDRTLPIAHGRFPGSRMKAGREHRVPLSPRALEILELLPREGDFVFPNSRGKPLSNTVLLTFLNKTMGAPLTVHGFRSELPRLGRRTNKFPQRSLPKPHSRMSPATK